MIENTINILNGFNVQTIISIGVLVWYFTRDLKNSIEKLDRDIQKMNTRISRVEGTLYGKNVYDKTFED